MQGPFLVCGFSSATRSGVGFRVFIHPLAVKVLEYTDHVVVPK